jgi:hypothetical protein
MIRPIGMFIDTATPLKCEKSEESLKLAMRGSRFPTMSLAHAALRELFAEWGKPRMKTLLNITIALAVTVSLAGCYSCKKTYDPCNGLTYRSKEFGSILFRKKGSDHCEACSLESNGEGCADCINGMHTMGGHGMMESSQGWQTTPPQAPPAATPDGGPKKINTTAYHYPVRQ